MYRRGIRLKSHDPQVLIAREETKRQQYHDRTVLVGQILRNPLVVAIGGIVIAEALKAIPVNSRGDRLINQPRVDAIQALALAVAVKEGFFKETTFSTVVKGVQQPSPAGFIDAEMVKEILPLALAAAK